MCEVKVESRTRVEEHGRTVLYEKIYRGVSTQGGGLRLLAYYRTIRSSRDFKGGYNHFLTSSDLKTWSYPQLLETLSALRKDGCRYERAA